MKLKKIFFLMLLLKCIGASSAVEPTSGRYIDTVEDLSIQVIGGPLVWERHYRDKQWRFNYSWSSLVFEYDTSSGQIRRIIRGKDTYEKLDSAGTLFKFGPRMRIKKNDDGTWTWKDRNGNSTEYAANGKTLSLHTQAGSFITLMYNGDDKLSGAKDVNDNQVLWITYDPINGQVDTVRDYGNREVTYTWEGINGSSPTKYKLTNVKDARGYDWQYAYGNSPATNGYVDLISMTDPELRETKIAYGGSGRVSSITNALGHVTSYQFDYIKARKEFYLKTSYPGGRITEKWYARDGEVKRRDVNGINLSTITEDQRKDIVKDTFGRTTVMEYDEFRNLLKTTYPDGSSTSATYDVTNSNILTRTDERGTVTQYEYFPNGRLQTMTEALGTPVERSTTYTYDSYGQIKTLTQVGDAVTETAITQYFYDAYGNMNKVINAENHETEYTSHDSMGNTLTMIDGRDKVWTYTYDQHGKRSSSTTPLQHKTSLEYDKVGNRIKVTYPDTNFIEYEYDDLNRLVKEIDELKYTQHYDYDSPGNLISYVDQSERITQKKYDQLNRLIEYKDPAGNITNYQYPESSDIDASSIFSVVLTKYPTYEEKVRYDLRDRVIEYERIFGNGEGQELTEVIKYRHDFKGNLIEETNQEGDKTIRQYDVLDRLIKITNKNQTSKNYVIDSRDNVIQYVNFNQISHRFTYDKLNNRTTELMPLNQKISYEFNANGYIEIRTDPKGQKKVYSYDDANRNTQLDFFDVNNDLKLSQKVEYNKRNRLTYYKDNISEGVFLYDAKQQKLEESINIDGRNFTSRSTYHGDGLKASYRDLNNITYNYFYNGLGLLENFVVPNEGTISYKNFNWYTPTSITYPGGQFSDYSYDGLQRIKGISTKNFNNQSILNLNYQYSSVGDVDSVQRNIDLKEYEYDAESRVVSERLNVDDQNNFIYDHEGNRLNESDLGQTQWIYNDNNQLISDSLHHYEYDANGNLIFIRDFQDQLKNEYVYDVQDRLTAVKDASGLLISQYRYDPFGRRLKKEVFQQGDIINTYFYYSDDGLSAEITGEEITSYIFHPQEAWSTNPILKKNEQGYYYYQNDHLGKPILIFSKEGEIVNENSFDVFGEMNDSVELNSDPWRFPGQYHDEETGWNYNLNRYYLPEIGRYNRLDPIFQFNEHDYVYVFNNPMRFYDPLGLYTIDPSCDNCDVTKDDIEDEAKRICENKSKNGSPALKKCLRDRCKKDGVIKCDNACEDEGEKGYNRSKTSSIGGVVVSEEPEKDIYLCTNDLKNDPKTEIGNTILHEFCHSCGVEDHDEDLTDDFSSGNRKWKRNGCPI